jgi:hypothetical protein
VLPVIEGLASVSLSGYVETAWMEDTALPPPYGPAAPARGRASGALIRHHPARTEPLRQVSRL